jgi:hypothetical protein
MSDVSPRLREVARIPLPSHRSDGGFDHAAVDGRAARLYVAHTANDCVDVIELASRKFSHSLNMLRGVAGVWIAEEPGLLFTSNRGEDTASVFRLRDEKEVVRVPTGSRPNGLAFDPTRGTLLVAGVGNRETGSPPTATFWRGPEGPRSQMELPGRSRWALYHREADAFFVNIADPPGIARIEGRDTSRIDRLIEVPAKGPHGLERSTEAATLYCACDDGQLVELDLTAGRPTAVAPLAGPPDVIWRSPRSSHLFVAIGDPGVVQVFRTPGLDLLDSLSTQEGAHTLTVDPATGEIHVFLPSTHEDLVLRDLAAD